MGYLGIWSSLVVWWRIPLWHSCAELPHGNGKFHKIPDSQRKSSGRDFFLHHHVGFAEDQSWISLMSSCNQASASRDSSILHDITVFIYATPGREKKSGTRAHWNREEEGLQPSIRHGHGWLRGCNRWLSWAKCDIPFPKRCKFRTTHVWNTRWSKTRLPTTVCSCVSNKWFYDAKDQQKGLKTPAVSVCFKAEEIERRRKAEEEFLGA